MAKESGLSWTTLSVDDSSGAVCDIRGDVTSLEFATPREEQDVTGVDKAAKERLLLLADFSIDLSGVFNPAASRSHAVLRTVPSTSVARTVTLTVSGQSITNECLFTDYKMKRSDGGELTWSSTGVLADGTVPAWT